MSILGSVQDLKDNMIATPNPSYMFMPSYAEEAYDDYDLGNYNKEVFKEKYGTEDPYELFQDEIVQLIDTSKQFHNIYNYVFDDNSVITREITTAPIYSIKYYISRLSDVEADYYHMHNSN